MKSELTGKSLTWRHGLVCPFCPKRITHLELFDDHIHDDHPDLWRAYIAIQQWRAWAWGHK